MLNIDLCISFLGMNRTYWERAETALNHLMADDAAATLLRHARYLTVEARDLGRAERVCSALQSCTREHRHMAVPALLALSLPSALERLRGEKVPDSILRDTFRDFARWAELYERRYGVWGAGEIPWLLYPFAGKMFTLGRLMYEPYEFPFPYRIYAVPGERRPVVLPAAAPPPAAASLVLAPGFPAINIHIPADGPLHPEQVDESLSQAGSFFTSRNYPSRAGVCDSWLLDHTLAQFLPREGNIVRFMERFVKLPLPPRHSTAEEYVFGANFSGHNLAEAPEDTYVQRALKGYLVAGGSVLDTAGVLWL